MNAIQIPCKTGEVSDGYHTFDELYEHRCTLFLALMKSAPGLAWISTLHDDGSTFGDWFIAGMCLPTGDVTYHLPAGQWSLACETGAKILDRAPKWDGHKPADVVKRVQAWIAPKTKLMHAPQETPDCNRNAKGALHAAQGSASGRLLYVYDYYAPDYEWRVYEALMLHAICDEMLMVLVDDNGAMRVVKERHLSRRNSASFFVYDHEFRLLAAEIEADWQNRRCWRLAYEDVQRLKARMQNGDSATNGKPIET